MEEEWFTLDSIELTETAEELYCIAVASPEKQFLAGELGVPTHNTEEGKEEDALKGEAAMIIGSIARLGRAAGVHLVIATQRPDASLISGETKANLGVRINCGRTDSNASSMILGTADGTRVKANPRGRLYLRIYGAGDHGQGLFASPDWIDEYLASKGLNPDGTAISGARSRLANLTDFSSFADSDLDSQAGVDNSAVIERIRDEEANGHFDDDDWGFSDDDEESMFGAADEGFSNSSSEPVQEDKLGRPEMGQNQDNSNRFHRPEEDWDNELDALINDNWDQ